MQSRTSDTIGFALSALAGFLLWVASAQITGQAEPWDGNPATYLVVLLLIGFGVTFGMQGRIRSPYLGAILGQVLFGLAPVWFCPSYGWLCGSEPDLAPLSLLILIAYSLPALAGSALARAILDRQGGG
jgi:hypothetical protein